MRFVDWVLRSAPKIECEARNVVEASTASTQVHAIHNARWLDKSFSGPQPPLSRAQLPLCRMPATLLLDKPKTGSAVRHAQVEDALLARDQARALEIQSRRELARVLEARKVHS